jgi:drug/metabolite transporter (DMT)-like permease
MWLLYTVLAVLSRAVYGVLTKVLSNHGGVSTITHTLFLLAAAALLSVLVLPFSGGFSLEGIDTVWPALVAALLTSAVGNITYFKGIAKLESGTTQIAFSSILLWSLLMAVTFLDTRLSLIQGLGVVVLLFAILLAQYNKKAIKLQPGILLILLSAASFAGFQVASATIAPVVNLGTYLVVIYAGTALLIALPYMRQIIRDIKDNRSGLKPLTKTAFITAGASVVNYIFLYFAYRFAPDPGVVVLLLTSQVVVAVILSVVFLKERTNIALKVAAGVLAMAAALMIKA